jgi:hypothetical protein
MIICFHHHICVGFGAGWFLDKVIVTNGATGKKNFFLFGRWLADDEGDKKLEAEVSNDNVSFVDAH